MDFAKFMVEIRNRFEVTHRGTGRQCALIAGLLGLGTGTDTIGRDVALVVALAGAGFGCFGSTACDFAARGFLRKGLTCLATLSHSERSSSLKARLRRDTGTSRPVNEFERFIGCDDSA